jgi:3'(2'), 5'-bisphosphate nucleotidase
MPADIEAVTALCQAAGRKLIGWRGDERFTSGVPDRPGKLVADLQLHDFMIEGLGRIDPGVPIVSEEDAEHTEPRPQRYWLIDPIDGTASWRGGFDGFVVQAALIENCEPVIGVIHAPASGRNWTGLRGRGAWRDGQRLPRQAASNRCIVVDNYPTPQRIAARLVAEMPATGYLESGSLGLKCCLVADGTADLFVKDVVVRDWDLAPAALLLAETGAVLQNVDGTPYRFSGPIEKPDGFIAAREAALAEAARVVIAAAPARPM